MKKFMNIIYTLIFAFVVYYFTLPALNLTSSTLYRFIFLVVIFYFIINLLTSFKIDTIINNKKVFKTKKYITIGVILGSCLVIMILINVFNSPLLNSKSYYERISVTNSDFNNDIKEVDFNSLALLDKDSSTKLGDRVMGQMTDLVSQFDVSNLYTQISYQNKIVRVTPLEYSGIIKYFTNRGNGVKGYITVDSVNGNAELVRLDKGMKYMPSALFFENLNRKLRFKYPTAIFGDISFELDDNGNPYWVVETIKYTGIGLKRDASGVITLDPITGESKKYAKDEVPEWVDHVYSADLIIEQLNDWGLYKNGYFNSLFGQKEVVMTTSGYNYMVMGTDVYLYTGITSVASDESNIGFVLTNLRTKETKFYNVAGAEEYSAMDSAKGQVQQMNYNSTFPLLINLNGKPTYLMSLKDNAGLVKMYAFVDYANYQKVVVTDASEGIISAAQNYLGGHIITGDKTTKKLTISSIKTANINGTTYYYFKNENDIYRASITVSESILPFLTDGDVVEITYNKSDINEVTEIKH